MTTLGEVKELYGHVQFSIALFGVSSEDLEKFYSLIQAIGIAVREEKGDISIESAMDLPPETELGTKAKEAFQELKAFCASCYTAQD